MALIPDGSSRRLDDNVVSNQSKMKRPAGENRRGDKPIGLSVQKSRAALCRNSQPNTGRNPRHLWSLPAILHQAAVPCDPSHTAGRLMRRRRQAEIPLAHTPSLRPRDAKDGSANIARLRQHTPNVPRVTRWIAAPAPSRFRLFRCP